MKLKSSTPFLFLAVSFLLWPSLSRPAAACNQTCGGRTLPFPFGFSSSCHIQLNCTSNATVLAADFPVLSITTDTILLNLPAACSRPVEALRRLFTPNFAPNFLNAVLLQNCSGGLNPPCFIPTTALTANFELLDCGHRNNSISCYSETDNKTLFMDYEKILRSGCRSLFSAISVDSLDVSPSVSLDVRIVRLGWWVVGSCDCSKHAKCIGVSPPLPEGKTPAYRCRCVEGFVGDGFREGVGCRRGINRAKDSITMVLASVSGVAIFAIAICCCCFLKRRRRQSSQNRKSNRAVEDLLLQHGALAPKRYKYSQIKKITISLSDKLGEGGFGSVYKGTLADGRLVAVKILSETDSDGEEFINEVASICRTSHVNIVTLLGFCYEGNKRALVYEYMPNKSLDKFLVDNVLDLNRLYEIAVGIARGLEYLHTGCTTRIVHFDIKPQNILLDEDFCPKISDFGLAKLCRKKQSVLSVLGMRGTAGYIAPEVFSRNYGGVSHKSDVYSYGMMLLEIAGAKKDGGTVVMQSSENYFPDKVYEKAIIEVSNNLDDESMMVEEEEEKRRKMMLTGFWCIQTVPSERPSISKVVEMLEGSLHSIQIPPKPFLFSTVIPNHESSSSFSTNVETENIAGD